MSRRQYRARFFVAPDGACHERGRPPLPSEKEAVWARDQGRCLRCGRELGVFNVRPFTFGWRDAKHIGHVDHIVPRARGGTNDLSNLRLVCGQFNVSRGADLEGTCAR